MAQPYRPVVTEGAGESFNPTCNQASGAQIVSDSIPSAAEVAEEAMCKRAAHHAGEEAYRRAKEASRGTPKSEPERWLSNEDLT